MLPGMLATAPKRKWDVNSKKQIEQVKLLSNLKLLYGSGKNKNLLRYVTDKAFNSVAKDGLITSHKLHLVMDAVCE